jgi:Domain of unknown function (DUF1905)
MSSQRFRGVIAADSKGRPVITVPFNPDQAWGAKADHPVGGTIDGRRVRCRLQPDGDRWVLPLGPRWQRDNGYATGDRVAVELSRIDATTRRPDVRAARIAEVTDLLAAGVKERPRPRS